MYMYIYNFIFEIDQRFMVQEKEQHEKYVNIVYIQQYIYNNIYIYIYNNMCIYIMMCIYN